MKYLYSFFCSAVAKPTIFFIQVGDRCEVEPGEKRGVVKFVGRAENIAPGFWIGVQYDEPLGKHDGTYARF